VVYIALAFILGYLAACWYGPAMIDYKVIDGAPRLWWIVER
jgi:hypothetical protein